MPYNDDRESGTTTQVSILCRNASRPSQLSGIQTSREDYSDTEHYSSLSELTMSGCSTVQYEESTSTVIPYFRQQNYINLKIKTPFDIAEAFEQPSNPAGEHDLFPHHEWRVHAEGNTQLNSIRKEIIL